MEPFGENHVQVRIALVPVMLAVAEPTAHHDSVGTFRLHWERGVNDVEGMKGNDCEYLSSSFEIARRFRTPMNEEDTGYSMHEFTILLDEEQDMDLLDYLET